MKVALLIPKWYPETGGGIKHVNELSKRLAEDYGCSVDIITKLRRTPQTSNSTAEKVRLMAVNNTVGSNRLLNELRYSFGIIKQIREKEYDIVHGHTNVTAFPLQIIRLITDSRTIFTVHGAQLDFSVTFAGSILDPIYSQTRRLILSRFRYDAMISVSEELSDVLSGYQNNVRFIQNGVDAEAFPEPAGYGQKQLLFVGRLRPKKNHKDVIKSMREVIKQHPDATLHLVGEGPMYDELAALIDELELHKHVELHGYVDDETLHNLYRKCSIFVLPSDWEGHPLVLLEAWASGQVIVGTDVEGIREFVDKGVGTTVPLNDPVALGETVSELLSSPERIKKDGTSARDLIINEYSWEKTVSQTYDLYCELLAE